MPNTHMIYRKEMAVFFNSPVAYIVLAVFAVMTSIFFSNTFFLNNQSDLRPLFEVVPWVFMFFVPAITMSLVARERQSGTLEFLVTLPVTDSQIIIGKFLAAFTLVATALGFSLVHFFTLIAVGKHVDVGAVLCGYFGLLLVGALYCAIGIFCSTVTDNQISAFILTLLIITVFFFFFGKMVTFVPAFLAGLVQYMSVNHHLEGISRGVMDSRNLLYFGSGIAFFLLVSTRLLEMRKWR